MRAVRIPCAQLNPVTTGRASYRNVPETATDLTEGRTGGFDSGGETQVAL